MRNDPPEPPRRFTCPICKRPLSASTEGPAKLPKFFPFCSERCKMIDLGAWFDADYRISAKPDETEESPGEDPPLDPAPPEE
jgi:hypothetical protein